MKNLSNQSYNLLVTGKSYLEGYITIFTPTYNRAELLCRVYEIIKNQTDRHFLWILVNDGSKDETDIIAANLVNKNEIPLLYLSKENGGKHSAFKAALYNTITEFFVCMDDDDLYDLRAVESFLSLWADVKRDGQYAEVGAIRTLTKEGDGFVSSIPIRQDIHNDFLDISQLDYVYKKRISQENWTCYITNALKQIDLFPQDYWLSQQHKFFLEGIWQYRFARKYKCRYVNICLREYRHDTATSIIRSNRTRQYYLDMFINNHMVLNENYDYCRLNRKLLVKQIVIVSVLRHKLGIPFTDLLSHTDHFFLKLVYCILYPFNWIVYRPKIA